ncbi:hypothetical protein AB4876_00775 [Zhongshania guokunii]|uniref:Uncharacterized protein n=1 Tax=Zhongshania guokunii TaxID=641783 RepID=A0ABV3U1B3_9GAMM
MTKIKNYACLKRTLGCFTLSLMVSSVSFAQEGVANLFSLSAGPGAALFAPVLDLGLLPRSVQNGGVVFQTGEDIVLGDLGPVGTVIGLGGPLKGQLIPVLDVLMENPLGLGDYLLAGGTLISTELALPPIPIVNAPLTGL